MKWNRPCFRILLYDAFNLALTTWKTAFTSRHWREIQKSVFMDCPDIFLGKLLSTGYQSIFIWLWRRWGQQLEGMEWMRWYGKDEAEGQKLTTAMEKKSSDLVSKMRFLHSYKNFKPSEFDTEIQLYAKRVFLLKCLASFEYVREKIVFLQYKPSSNSNRCSVDVWTKQSVSKVSTTFCWLKASILVTVVWRKKPFDWKIVPIWDAIITP